MGAQDDLLKILAGQEEAAKTSELAQKLKTGESSVRTFISRLKRKKFIEGDAKTGWFITDAGRDQLESGEEIETTLKDIGKDELSQFKKLGNLAGAEADDIAAAAELFQNADMRSMDEFKRVMAEASIPMTVRTKWENLYRNFLRLGTPPAERDIKYPLPKVQPAATSAGGETKGEGTAPREDALDFIVEGTEIHRVAEGLGEFTFKEALQVVAAKRGTSARGNGEGGSSGLFTAFADALKNMKPDQPITISDLLDVIDRVKSQGGGNPSQDGYIDEDGNYQTLQPGQRVVVIKKEAPPSSGKTWLVRHTDKGMVKEEYQPGEPIIIETAAPPQGGGMPSMMPYPVIGADGKPVTDDQGRVVYANIGPMVEWMKFTTQQRREEDRHNMLMKLGETVRENVPDGIRAIIDAVNEARAERGTQAAKKEATPEKQAYQCGKCKTQFYLPEQEGWTQLKCPGCGFVWPREEVLKQ